MAGVATGGICWTFSTTVDHRRPNPRSGHRVRKIAWRAASLRFDANSRLWKEQSEQAVVDLHICNSGTSENVAAPISGALLSSGNLESNERKVTRRGHRRQYTAPGMLEGQCRLHRVEGHAISHESLRYPERQKLLRIPNRKILVHNSEETAVRRFSL